MSAARTLLLAVAAACLTVPAASAQTTRPSAVAERPAERLAALRTINTAVNRAFTYGQPHPVWGPFYCEAYAWEKQRRLIEAGVVAEADTRIVYLDFTRRGEAIWHAVLVVRIDGRDHVLDSIWGSVASPGQLQASGYRPWSSWWPADSRKISQRPGAPPPRDLWHVTVNGRPFETVQGEAACQARAAELAQAGMPGLTPQCVAVRP